MASTMKAGWRGDAILRCGCVLVCLGAALALMGGVRAAGAQQLASSSRDDETPSSAPMHLTVCAGMV
ncbi:MAG: hypothetical protein KJZ78_11585, partial [Bryobacteraceae bacterium]|nr:hypothetical protein [Bryobacteraceae bacterium]